MNSDQQLLEPRLAADCIPSLRTDLFSDLSRSDVESLAQHMEVRTLAQGQFLIRQDEPGDSLYVADFYIRFPVQDYGLTDFSKLKTTIAETGYSYACDTLIRA